METKTNLMTRESVTNFKCHTLVNVCTIQNSDKHINSFDCTNVFFKDNLFCRDRRNSLPN